MTGSLKDKRGLRVTCRILIALAVLATLIAVFYTEEDWRAKSARDSYQREWEAKGEQFDWQAFIPPSVPDDQNFFTAPIFTNLLNDTISMSVCRSDDSYPANTKGNWPNASMTDLKAWQNYYRHPGNPGLAKEFPVASQPQMPAADVLLAWSKFDPAIEQHARPACDLIQTFL